MKILTFDTSLDKMYVTIGENSQADLSRIVENTKERYHSALLIPTIIELLKEKNLMMQDINAIGVNVGPGSFTGIRSSATVARVIAQNLNIPVVGVPSLEIISLINDTDKNCLVALDARKGKAYTGIYNPEGDEILKPQALDYEEVINRAKDNDFFVVGDKKMTEKFRTGGLECISLESVDYNFGISLAKLTYKHLKQGGADKYSWLNLKPLYIQPPPISMPKTTC